MAKESIVVGLSGGVDSAVCAHLLQRQGYDVQAVFMKNWDEDDDQHCSATEDLADAKEVCAKLAVPLKTVNFSSEYWDLVFEYFLAEHRAGRTPNPDILCNTEIKFKVFLDYASQLGVDRIATGHYARIAEEQGHYQLLCGLDQNKDQSYFLHGLNQSQLSQSIMPLGAMEKSEVRQIAADLDLNIHDKKDSTGICFIGERKFSEFLQQYLPSKRGDIVDLDGNIVGQHQGATFFTIGQRQGLGIGGRADSSAEPWYVVDKDMLGNKVIVAQGSEHPALFNQRLQLEEIHWIDPQGRTYDFNCSAKIRYRQSQQPCQLMRNEEGHAELVFDQAQRAVTPGQFAVLYDGDRCLGGAVIQLRK
ncbi:MAG: tRNA 2-thiouridine(34) synthase MnmA [Gammaproteobacteria bacterium]|nr:tRNA 2-thiouridine(34) synthase MnmA [Gammaproteobacteria bacterium]